MAGTVLEHSNGYCKVDTLSPIYNPENETQKLDTASPAPVTRGVKLGIGPGQLHSPRGMTMSHGLSLLIPRAGVTAIPEPETGT